MDKVKVALIGNLSFFRQGLENVLKADSRIRFVYTCEATLDNIKAAKLRTSNVVLIDSKGSDINVIDLISYIRKTVAAARIIIISSIEKISEFFPSINAGATGFISPDCPFENLVNAINLASKGWFVVDPILADLVVQAIQHQHKRMYSAKPANIKLLSSQERKVLSLMTRCTNNKEIADILFTTENTIKVHVHNIMHKLGARDRREATICAIEGGLGSKDNRADS
jgi:DNA-binding NarL/FixJ family response regulator